MAVHYEINVRETLLRKRSQQPQHWLSWWQTSSALVHDLCYSLCLFPPIWPESTELWCWKWATSPPEVYSNSTRRVSQHKHKGEGGRLTPPPFHLALPRSPPRRYSRVIYAVATGKIDITHSWQCATSKLRSSGDGSKCFTSIPLHCYFRHYLPSVTAAICYNSWIASNETFPLLYVLYMTFF